MKHLKLIYLFLLLITVQTHAAKGGVGDGGGQAVVCRNDNGDVTSAEMLDIFEAKNFFGLTMSPVDPSSTEMTIAMNIASQIGKAMAFGSPTSKWTTTVNSISSVSYDLGADFLINHKNGEAILQGAVQRILLESKRIPSGVIIAPVGDSNPLVLPSKKGCQLEQVAVYKDNDNQVYFVQDIWNSFDYLNKAGLLLHEAIYRELRLTGDVTSDRTRKIVGHALADYKFSWLFEDAPETVLSCWTTDPEAKFRFMVHKFNDNLVTAHFLMWNGEVPISLVKTNLPMAPFAKRYSLPSPLEPNNGTSMLNQIKDPLLNMQNYSFSYGLDNNQNVYMTIQTAGRVFDQDHALPISCNNKFTKYIINEDGSKVSIDHADSP